MSAHDTPALTEIGAHLVNALEAAREDTARVAADAMRAEIPGYGRISTERFFEDAREHVAAHVDLLVRSLRGGRLPSTEELPSSAGPRRDAPSGPSR